MEQRLAHSRNVGAQPSAQMLQQRVAVAAYRVVDSSEAEAYSGGWSPLARSTLRILTSDGRFNCSAATVARPDAVMPSMFVAFSSQRKCVCPRLFADLGSVHPKVAPATRRAAERG